VDATTAKVIRTADEPQLGGGNRVAEAASVPLPEAIYPKAAEEAAFALIQSPAAFVSVQR
jgi:hypothetical protein